MKIKRCSKCGEVKPVSEFSKDKSKKDRLYCWCKECDKESNRKYRENNKEKVRKKSRKWAKNNIGKVKEWQKNNSEKVIKYKRKWINNNPEKVKEKNRKAYKKFNSIPKNRLNQRISKAIYYSLKGNKNGNHWEDLVGYTLKDLMIHLKNQFKNRMSWNNYGKWHIDHIRPISSFNFKSCEDKEFKQCWALKNLQPLWANENLSKGARF